MKKIMLLPILLALMPQFILKADESHYAAPGQIKISEINPGEDQVSLKNLGNSMVDLAGWAIYDENDRHELFLTEPDIIRNNAGGGLQLAPRTELVISGKNDNDFRLYNAGGEVRLYSGPVEIDGKLEDKITYPAVEEGKSYKIFFPDPDQNGNHDSNPEKNADPDIIDKIYQIPENTDIIDKNNKITENKNGNHTLENPASQSKMSYTTDKRSLNENSNISYELDQSKSSDQENFLSNNNTNLDTLTFTASAPLKRSPWGWFYWLWNSWFLRRIILPLLSLWTILFCVIFLIRKKFLRNE